MNHIAYTLHKPASQFTKADIISYCKEQQIEMVNFMYPAADGRLKTLNFVINDPEYLDTILSHGERVDGSSLFSHIEAGNSDLYVIPRFSTAFLDPFAPLPTVTMLCTFFNKEGKPMADSPEETLHRACRAFHNVTGLDFQAMGELEYYVIAPVADNLYPATDQRGYHESAPFAKFSDFRTRAMNIISSIGGRIKYGHSEVGNFTEGQMVYEQQEIEFLPVAASDAADQLTLAKWALRNLAAQMNLTITFAPKITAGKAGSGLHIHMRYMRPEGKSAMLDANRNLSSEARTAIAGMMELAPSITAFGNTNPTSYFRLVPHQEAPTNVCWGDRNRSVLVRVPLGWTADSDMCAAVNPGSSAMVADLSMKQTIEIRSADASANIYLLLAALAVACRHGWEMEHAAEKAEATYVDVNIHSPENAARLNSLNHLPASCHESADALEKDREVYRAHNVFPDRIIDATLKSLRSFADADSARTDPEKMRSMVDKYCHCG